MPSDYQALARIDCQYLVRKCPVSVQILDTNLRNSLILGWHDIGLLYCGMIDQKTIEAFSKELQEEIRFKRQVSKDSIEPGEPIESFESIIQMLMCEMDDPDFSSTMRKELQDFGIKLGIFSANTKADLANIVVLGHGKKYDFKRGGIYYRFEDWKALKEDQ